MNDFYTDLAAELRALADDVESLSGRGLPDAWVNVRVHLSGASATLPDAVIDQVAVALVGGSGETKQLSGLWLRAATGRRGAIRDVDVFGGVDAPPDERDDELARLRTEVARLSGGAV